MKRFRRVSIVFLLCVLVFGAHGALWAGEDASPDSSALPDAVSAGAGSSSFGASFGLGTALVDGESYQSISFIPDLAFGQFGIGLDVTLNYQLYRWSGDRMGFYVRAADWIIDEDGNARPDPWNDDSLQTYLDLYLSKIVYLRYGTKGSPLYVKLGLFEDGKLGNGFIMNGYANSLLRPEYSYSGLAFDLDGSLFGLPFVGIETFTNSVSTFDIAGGRVYVRPLAPFSVPVLEKLQIGATAVLDSDPYVFMRRLDRTDLIDDPDAKAAAVAARDAELAKYGEADVLVCGIDVRQPLVNLRGAFSLDLIGDFVLQGSASGAMVGIGGNLAFLSYGAQVRFLGENFQPVYFDRSYDLSRVQKLKTYLLNTDEYGDETDLTGSPAMNGWYASAGTSLLGGKIAFFSSLEGPLGAPDGDAGDSAVAWPKLRSSLTVDGRQMLPVPVTLTAFYDKDYLKKPADVFSPENALVGAKLGYQLGAASIQLTYNLKYVPEYRRIPGQEAWEISSKLETVISLN